MRDVDIMMYIFCHGLKYNYNLSGSHFFGFCLLFPSLRVLSFGPISQSSISLYFKALDLSLCKFHLFGIYLFGAHFSGVFKLWFF